MPLEVKNFLLVPKIPHLCTIIYNHLQIIDYHLKPPHKLNGWSLGVVCQPRGWNIRWTPAWGFKCQAWMWTSQAHRKWLIHQLMHYEVWLQTRWHVLLTWFTYINFSIHIAYTTEIKQKFWLGAVKLGTMNVHKFVNFYSWLIAKVSIHLLIPKLMG